MHTVRIQYAQGPQSVSIFKSFLYTEQREAQSIGCSQRCTYHRGISCFVGGLVRLVPIVLKPLGLLTKEFRLSLSKLLFCHAQLLLSLPKLLLSLSQLLLSIVGLLGFAAQLRVEVEVELWNSLVAVDFHQGAVLQQLFILALEPLDFLL